MRDLTLEVTEVGVIGWLERTVISYISFNIQGVVGEVFIVSEPVLLSPACDQLRLPR